MHFKECNGLLDSAQGVVHNKSDPGGMQEGHIQICLQNSGLFIAPRSSFRAHLLSSNESKKFKV